MSTASIAAAAGAAARTSTGTAPAGRAFPDAAPAPLRTPAAPPRLTLVPDARSRVARTPFVLMACGLLAGGLLALLLLNTVLAQDAFALHDLEKRSAGLDARQAALGRQLAEEAAPQRLAQRAVAMGMVPSENPAFLRASDGRVLGSPTAGRTGSGAFAASGPLGSSTSPGRPPRLLTPPVSSLVAPASPLDLLAPPATALAEAKPASPAAKSKSAVGQKGPQDAGAPKTAPGKATADRGTGSKRGSGSRVAGRSPETRG